MLQRKSHIFSEIYFTFQRVTDEIGDGVCHEDGVTAFLAIGNHLPDYTVTRCNYYDYISYLQKKSMYLLRKYTKVSDVSMVGS